MERYYISTMIMKSISFCLLVSVTFVFCNSQKRSWRRANREIIQIINNTRMSFDFDPESELKIYSDTLNNLSRESPLPDFLFNERFDYKKHLWPSLHSPTSLRHLVIDKVTNRSVIERILQDSNPSLHKICNRPDEFAVPDGDKSFYELFKLRYAEMKLLTIPGSRYYNQ